MKKAVLLLLLLPLLVGMRSPSPTIYYVKHTTDWPVNLAARSWNENGEVRLVRVSSCSGRYRCVEVWDGPLPYPQIAVTVGWWTTRPEVVLDPAYRGMSRSCRREIVTHEFGHVLGLDHHRYSPMEAYVSCRYPVPTARDLERVRERWST